MSEIETVVRIYYSDTKYWDISPMITKVDIIYGRNQPFMYQELEANKLYFSSLDAYWTANADQNTPRDNQNNILLPSDNIVDGQTKIFIQAYGLAYTLLLERHESNEDQISLVCYNSAYYMQSSGSLKRATTIHLESGTPYVYGIGPMHDVGDKYTVNYQQNSQGYYYFTFIDPTSADYSLIFRTTIKQFATTYTEGGETYNKIYRVGDVVFYSDKFYICIQTTGSTSQIPQTPQASSQYWSQQGDITPLYIEGTGTNIFKYMSFIVANYETFVVDSGFSYDYTQIDSTIYKSYTLQQIDTIKSAQKIQSNDTYKIRVDNNYSCWEILKSIGQQSNRWPFFYDYAYFVDYSSTSQIRDTIQSLDIDYGVDNLGNSNTRYTRNGTDYDYINLYSVVKNADQGSEYVQTSQKVYQETYNTDVSISDSVNTSEGYPLYFPYPESDPTDPQYIDNLTRNQIIRKIAFNRVVQNYKPSDAVQFQYSEVGNTGGINPIGIFEDAEELPTTGVTQDDYAIVIEDGIFHTYYRYDGSDWSQVTMSDIVQGQYEQKFQPYAVVGTINDVQNGMTLTNVPLACVEIIWPNCITQVTFGNPEFMDAQKQWKSLSLESQISTIEGSEGSNISDKYASKIVIGNQNMSDLQDDREGFTGLIMEKNYDNELYRLSGYNDGELQAYFNSKGEIMSGNNKVKINADGITITSGGGTIDPSVTGGIQPWDVNKTYAVGDIVQWNGKIYSCLVADEGTEPGTSEQNVVWETSGNISVWSVLDVYAVGDFVVYNGMVYECILQTGNTHYAPDTQSGRTYWQSIIDTSNQNVQIIGGSSSQQPQTDTTKQSKTVIDNNGLTTYNQSGSPVCRVGTDGNIYGINLSVSGVVTGILSADHIDASSLTVGYATSQGSASTANSTNTPHVVIDNSGLRTYGDTSTVQCSVGTNGYITQGEGNITLSRSGMLVNSTADDTTATVKFDNSWSTSSGWALTAYPKNTVQETLGTFSISHWGTNTTSLYISDRLGLQMITGGGTSYVGTYNQGHMIYFYSSGSNYSGYIMFHRGNRSEQNVNTKTYPLVLNFGFYQQTSSGIDSVSFPRAFNTKCISAGCTTVRYGSGWDSFDHVSGSSSSDTEVGNNGMYCLHDSGQGFYWYAIGY